MNQDAVSNLPEPERTKLRQNLGYEPSYRSDWLYEHKDCSESGMHYKKTWLEPRKLESLRQKLLAHVARYYEKREVLHSDIIKFGSVAFQDTEGLRVFDREKHLVFFRWGSDERSSLKEERNPNLARKFWICQVRIQDLNTRIALVNQILFPLLVKTLPTPNQTHTETATIQINGWTYWFKSEFDRFARAWRWQELHWPRDPLTQIKL